MPQAARMYFWFIVLLCCALHLRLALEISPLSPRTFPSRSSPAYSSSAFPFLVPYSAPRLAVACPLGPEQCIGRARSRMQCSVGHCCARAGHIGYVSLNVASLYSLFVNHRPCWMHLRTRMWPSLGRGAVNSTSSPTQEMLRL
ncbi:hypothetical protein BDV96DRAFT_302726 [Lophiotrema nucula]|uniref:Hydrophobin n=1 Tax=Lophiotrema nucula TaxID=690887 RepID=A0A6A5YJV0_9PLEO|nr:hypothetical protein BDV96DRAFT_302726 [Lophiotrema nucula]